jgi:hypothetical protein
LSFSECPTHFPEHSRPQPTQPRPTLADSRPFTEPRMAAISHSFPFLSVSLTSFSFFFLRTYSPHRSLPLFTFLPCISLPCLRCFSCLFTTALAFPLLSDSLPTHRPITHRVCSRLDP